MDELPTILCDTREKTPWEFPGLVVVRRKLEQADYTIEGLETRLGLERKAPEDLLLSLSSGRERFEREMDRLATYERACIVVEAQLDDLVSGLVYRSRMRPAAIVGSVGSIWARWGVATIFAGSRESAQLIARAILLKAHRHLLKAAA